MPVVINVRPRHPQLPVDNEVSMAELRDDIRAGLREYTKTKQAPAFGVQWPQWPYVLLGCIAAGGIVVTLAQLLN